MNDVRQKSKIEEKFFVLYFVVATIEIISELFSYKELLFVFKPLIPVVLIGLYWINSKKRNLLFFVLILLAMITDVLFIANIEWCLFLGLLFFL